MKPPRSGKPRKKYSKRGNGLTEDANVGLLEIDFTGIPPGRCHGCGQPFAPYAVVVLGRSNDERLGLGGLMRVGWCCLPMLDRIIAIEWRWPPGDLS